MSPPPVVGVLGGTFDPIHLGHIAVARKVRERTGIERVLFVPGAAPPHKSSARVTPAVHREAMLRLALADVEGAEVSTLELDTGRVCYTIDTLRRLRRGPPAVVPVFVLGMDALCELETWKEHRSLLREFDLIVVDRRRSADAPCGLAPELARTLVGLPAGRAGRLLWTEGGPGRGGRIFRLRTRPIPVSSSDVRARAASGRNLTGLVPPAVARYISTQGLYR